MLPTFLLLLLLLWVVTLFHELGHAVAIRLRGGRILAVRLGRGPSLRIPPSSDPSGTRWTLGLLPVGGRITFEGIGAGTPRAVVAAAGPAANLALAAVLLPSAAAVAEWLWMVPGAVAEVLTLGRTPSLLRGMQVLGSALEGGSLRTTGYGLGALSALWTALNLIPIPGATDGWKILQGLGRGLRASLDRRGA